ncbi:Gfo/Idh/MocA family oxidoreductase [Catenulispora sp. NL8]|uniref:Gfo/Idh/MocA family oxidoreductase n=1 Tax=Catenulispora pinistramenti TaxID=2705254 RepID=A0ABS5L482_9ACTN|nr:Gfo/Idh/MocA family oxidoreductase [Catenulispora pinistramenti]MBS2553178.1 Gfo/Idh/MocA family oxidoreductase [Catenulispora pinistramenti]
MSTTQQLSATQQSPVTLALVGAGMRGLIYARHALASGAGRIAAIAEPREENRKAAAVEFGVPEDAVFDDWRALATALAAGQVEHIDAAVIATQDRMHLEPAVAFAGLGCHLLLEKPMAPNEADSRRIVEAAEAADVILAVCHVMRYTPYTRTLKQVLDAGTIGDIISVQHLEPVGWWHQAHSFVRGNWRSERESSPMLLAKSSHDVDWLIHIIGEQPARVCSFGSLTHFREQNAPAGSTANCLDCPVENTCPYSAKRIYLDCLGDPEKEFWPLSVVTSARTEEGVLDALRGSQYGRCVYRCDNDVVDHQVVDLEFPSGATASFTMTAFTRLEHRKTRIFGTRGLIEGDGVRLWITDFLTDTDRIVDTGTDAGASAAEGHGGGDRELLDRFLEAVATGDRAKVLSDGPSSLATHRAVWAAERARTDGAVVVLDANPTPHL